MSNNHSTPNIINRQATSNCGTFDAPVLSQFDTLQLRQVLGDFATGVTVLACNNRNDDGPLAMTVNAFTSVSLDPPLVLVSLATTARVLPHMKCFSISFLSAEQEEVAIRCGSSKNNPEQAPYWAMLNDLPVVKDAAAYLGCRVVVRHRHGDHFLVVSEVSWIARRANCAVLTFYRGKFATLA